MRLLILLPVILFSRGSSAALLQRNAINYTAAGIALTHTIAYHPPHTEYTHTDAPGGDIEPPGVAIYDTLSEVPTAKLLSRARSVEKCYAERPCWSAYVCGHRCEQVLMRVTSWCRKRHDWLRCPKARKYMRCFARVCFRRSGTVMPEGTPPASYEDKFSVAIVRYRRPLPKHEVLARRNKQSSTQSAIFK